MGMKVRPHQRDDRSQFSDEDLYLVAAAVAVCGIAPSRIATALDKDPIVITRMLQRAYTSGILRLNFLPKRQLEATLGRARKDTIFHVVPDRFKPFPYNNASVLGFDPVCIKAADVIRERIERALAEKANGPLRVGVTGGYSLAKTVEALAGDIQNRPPPGADRLEFVALNSAQPITSQHISSNHLVTRLAIVYSDGFTLARHLAVAENCVPKLRARYQEAVQNLDLVLVSGGATAGSYLSDYLQDLKLPLPEDAVGDLAYVTLRRDGKHAQCSEATQRAIDELRPALKYEQLISYAADGKMIVVLSEHRNVLWVERSHDDLLGPGRVSKLPLALALMRVKLASEIILGQTLAEEIIKELQLTVPPPDPDDIRDVIGRPRGGRSDK
jgi:hypothetical protein